MTVPWVELMENIYEFHQRTNNWNVIECFCCVSYGSDKVRFEYALYPSGKVQYSRAQRTSRRGCHSGHNVCVTVVRYSIAGRSLQGCQQPEADKRAFSASQHQMIEPRLAPYKIQRRPHIDARYYFDLAFAQDRGQMIYQTQCTAIVLYKSAPAGTLVRVVKINNSEG